MKIKIKKYIENQYNVYICPITYHKYFFFDNELWTFEMVQDLLAEVEFIRLGGLFHCNKHGGLIKEYSKPDFVINNSEVVILHINPKLIYDLEYLLTELKKYDINNPKLTLRIM